MAGDWIKLEAVTPDKPEVFGIAEKIGCSHGDAFLACARLWIWADQQSLKGNALSVTKMSLDRVSGLAGFHDALLSVGWLRERNGVVALPNFERHNGKTAKTRALAARRAATHKERKGNGAGVTLPSPREEKRRSKPPIPPFVLPKWVPENEWAAFEETRKRMRKPMTDRAKELVVLELAKLRDAGHDPAAVLQQSVRKSWLDVFPLKGGQSAPDGEKRMVM